MYVNRTIKKKMKVKKEDGNSVQRASVSKTCEKQNYPFAVKKKPTEFKK
jgi:hypothetical protein